MKTMVELINAVILDNLAPKEGVNLSFDIGLNEISYEKRYIFNFLLLRNQALDSGSFVVNNKTIVPLENADTSLFLLAVNSQNISMSICFDVEKETRKEVIRNIQEDLSKLRDLPLNSNQDRLNKLDKIFVTVEKYHPAYVLINMGNDINKSSKGLLDLTITDHSANITIITLDSKDKVVKTNTPDELDIGLTRPVAPNEDQPVSRNEESSPVVRKQEEVNVLEQIIPDEPEFYDHIVVGGPNAGFYRQENKAKKERKPLFFKSQPKSSPKKEEAPKEVVSASENKPVVSKEPKEPFKIDFHYIKKLFKKEWSSFLFILYGTVSTVFFFLVVPFQFGLKEEGTSSYLSYIFLIGGILCLVVTILIESSLFAFMDTKPYSKKRYWYSFTFSEIFTIIGFVLAFVLLKILNSHDIMIKGEYSSKYYIVGVIFGILIMVIPCLMKYIRLLTNFVKKIFSKKGNKEQ